MLQFAENSPCLRAKKRNLFLVGWSVSLNVFYVFYQVFENNFKYREKLCLRE